MRDPSNLALYPTPHRPLLPQVKLLNLSGWVVTGGRRGDNVIRHMGDGITVDVRRPLLASPPPPPPMAVAVRSEVLVVSLLDAEYHKILAILAGNFGEQVGSLRRRREAVLGVLWRFWSVASCHR